VGVDGVQYLYGGYTKRQEDDGVGVGVMEKGHVFTDLWALDLATYVWTKVKRAGVPPGPRAGFTFAGTHASALATLESTCTSSQPVSGS